MDTVQNFRISSQISRSHSRHPSVARTSSSSSSSFPPLLINHTSIRLVNPGIPGSSHAPHVPRLCFVHHLYRGTRNNRRSLSWIDRGIPRCHRDEKEVETYIHIYIHTYIAYNITIRWKIQLEFVRGRGLGRRSRLVGRPVWFYQANLVGSLSKLNGTH